MPETLPDPGPYTPEDADVIVVQYGLLGEPKPLQLVAYQRRAADHLRHEAGVKGVTIKSAVKTGVVNRWELDEEDQRGIHPNAVKVVLAWCRADERTASSFVSPPAATAADGAAQASPAESATPASGGTTPSPTGATSSDGVPPTSLPTSEP